MCSRGINVGERCWISGRMYGSLDLGYHGAVAVVLLIFAHVIAAVIRRRWRLAQARREEVIYLVKLASEETARAELEAAMTYVTAPKSSIDVSGESYVGVPSRFECAVCRRPSNTRCSRCKAVRYCSDTCQIIHWRQGHKDECHHPQVNHQDKRLEINPFLRDRQEENCDSLINTAVIKKSTKLVASNLEEQSSCHNLSTYGLSTDDLLESRTLLDSFEAKHCPSSFVDSSASSSIHPDSFVKSSEEALLSHHHAKTSEGLSCDGYSNCPQIDVDRGCIGFSSAGSCDTTLSAKNLSRTRSSKKEPFTYSSKDIMCRQNDSCLSDIVHSNHAKTAEFSQCPGARRKSFSAFDAMSNSIPSKHPKQNGISEARSSKENSCVNVCDEGTKESSLRDYRGFGSEKSNFDPGSKKADGRLPNSRKFRSISVSLADRAFTSGRKHSVSDNSFTKVGNASAVPSKLSKTAVLVSSSISDLRTSFRRAVHQLKFSQSSRSLTALAASDVSWKYKLMFPYEFFVELYNLDKVDMKPFGLFNCGNSCFANAVLQCLAHTRPLVSYLYQGLHSGTCSRREWCFTCEFENLILRGKQGESPLSPVGILSNIEKIGSHFGHGKEEDAHEFLRHAIDAMQSSSTYGAVDAGKYSEDTSLIQLTFGGYLRSEVKCMKCRSRSEQLERIMDLTVEINGDICTLEEALKMFTATEVLDGDNRYHCSRCKSFERAKKRLSVFEAPNVLTIALKRFQLGKFGKLNKLIRFPAHLDLSPYETVMDRSPLYNLYALVVHEDVKNASFSGHYVCYVKSLKGNWYLINDKEVTPVEFERVLNQNAYMLFYARSSPQAPSLIRNKTIPEDHRGSFQPSDLFNGRDSSSDSLSLSCSDEGSWSTESTRNSTSTEDLSDYLFGAARPSRCGRAFRSSPVDSYSDYITYCPSTSRDSFRDDPGEEDLEVKGSNSFLYCDRTNNYSSILRENYRGRENEWNNNSSIYGEKSSMLQRSSTVRERRHQTLY